MCLSEFTLQTYIQHSDCVLSVKFYSNFSVGVLCMNIFYVFSKALVRTKLESASTIRDGLAQIHLASIEKVQNNMA
jgi:hypothetical protein